MENGYSKYELLEAVIKATRDKSITLDEIEKQMRALKVKPDDLVSDSVRKAVVDHFKLAKQVSRSDKAMISALKKENARLREENQHLKQIIDGKIDQIGGMLEEMYDNTEPVNVDTAPSTDDYRSQQLNLNGESPSQQQ